MYKQHFIFLEVRNRQYLVYFGWCYSNLTVKTSSIEKKRRRRRKVIKQFYYKFILKSKTEIHSFKINPSLFAFSACSIRFLIFKGSFPEFSRNRPLILASGRPWRETAMRKRKQTMSSPLPETLSFYQC